ncbi:hypothetical protein BURK1_03476 [Burkholderiales bacterium]|nr:hypothetical protein BURK1_03476 [Burkholderiales bacterium]
MSPDTRYARSGEVSIACQVTGGGPIDLIVVPGWVSNVEVLREDPAVARFLERLASFSRLILFDKRGTGLSDRIADMPTLETRMDDARAVGLRGTAPAIGTPWRRMAPSARGARGSSPCRSPARLERAGVLRMVQPSADVGHQQVPVAGLREGSASLRLSRKVFTLGHTSRVPCRRASTGGASTSRSVRWHHAHPSPPATTIARAPCARARASGGGIPLRVARRIEPVDSPRAAAARRRDRREREHEDGPTARIRRRGDRATDSASGSAGSSTRSAA